MAEKKDGLARWADALRKKALAYPETREDHPWGETAIKVRGKVFLFMGRGDGDVGVSLKLPQAREFALTFPFATPTGYGLGPCGWVSFRLSKASDLDPALAAAWLDESFRAVAPKKLLAAMDGGAANPAPRAKRPPARKRRP